MRAHACLIPAIALLAACSEDDAPAARTGASAAGQQALADAPAAPVAAPASPATSSAVVVDEKTDLYEYYFAYPAQAAAIPALKAQMDAALASGRAELAGEARDGQGEAKQADIPFHPHTRDVVWQVVTDLPGWLSLSATISVYSGGAHPNHWFGSMLWDKAQARRVEVADLFTSKQALSRAIRAPFCDRLDRERAERRGEPVNRASGDMFSECIDPAEQTLILGSTNRRVFNRLGVLVAPYEAGPYAEGSYDVTLPVTDAVIAAVRPEYRAAFATLR